MTMTRARSPRAILLFASVIIAMAAPRAGLSAGGAPQTKAVKRVPGGARVIAYNGDVEAFLGGLERLVEFDLLYRYPMVRGAAVSVPAASVDRVIAFAESKGLRAVRDAVARADLNQSTKTIHVKNSGSTQGAWALGYTGAGVSVAIIDSGIDANHMGLDDMDDDPLTNDPKVLHFRDFVGGVGTDTAPYDEVLHGTHVSGITAGTGEGSSGDGPRSNGNVGVAYEANLVGLKVLHGDGRGTGADFLAAAQWLHDNWNTVDPPVRVVNMSMSFSGGGLVNNGNSVYSQAVDGLADVGIIPVASGGNGQCNGGCENTTTGNIAVPSDARKAISICSSNSAVPPAAPTYSNWDSEGPTADGRNKPEVCAPGDSILSAAGNTNSLYIGFGGTSMSAPHISGVAALMVQAFPCITPAQAKQALIETAREYPSWNFERGYGEAHARNAIARADELTNCSALVASAGGPYNVYQGENVALTASAVGGTPPMAFAWDLDNDGSFDDATGASASFSDTGSTGGHTVRVRVTDDGGVTAVGNGTVTVLPATNIHSDNVEGGVAGWVAAGGTGPIGWHQTTVRSRSATHSWYPGDDTTQVYAPAQALTLTRTFDLSTPAAMAADTLRLRFARSGSLEPTFDFLYAEKRVGAGSFTTLERWDNYEGGDVWTTHGYDVTAHRGQQLDVRFRFTSDDFNDVPFIDATGPFVDDISIADVSAPTPDTTAPAAITTLATGVPTETAIPLTWTAPGDDANTGTAAAYDLRRSLAPITAADFAFATPVPGVPAPQTAGSAESFTVTGLTPNTPYYFAIKALDEVSNSGALSNVVSASTLADLIPPSVVTGLAGLAGNAQVSLSWNAATDNVAVDGYRVWQDGSMLAGLTAGLSRTITGLTNGQTYGFQVQAVDTAGNPGPLTTVLNLTPLAPQSVAGWPETRGGPGRTGAIGGRGSILVPSIRQTLAAGGTPIDASPVVVDLDRDGKLDVLIVGDQSGTTPTTVRAFRQTATGLVPMWTYAAPAIAGSTTGWGNIAVGNLDGGGGLEVVLYSNSANESPVGFTVGGVTNNESRVAVLNAASGALIGEVSAATLAFGMDLAPVVGDVTGDGIAEAILFHDHGTSTGGGASGFHVLGIGVDGGAVSTVFDSPIAGSTWTSLALGELRSDPGLELVLGDSVDNASGRVVLCKPVAGNAVCNESIATPTGIMGVSVADLDGSAPPEIVANGRTGTSLNVVKAAGTLSLVSRADGFLWNTASLGDVDGDGRPDIVNVENSNFVNDTAKAGNVRVRGFDGAAIIDKGQLTRTPSPGGNAQSWGGGALLDIAGTGTAEFVFADAEGNLVGVSPAPAPVELWSMPLGGAATAPVAAGDVTGDGLLDIVAATSAGNVVVVGAGPAAQLKLSPATATVVAGAAQLYTARSYDAVGNPLEDVTGSTTFAIAGGTCVANSNSCSSTTAGTHTVTGTMGSLSGTATLTVTPGPLDHIVVSPASATITAGGSQAFTAEGFDAFNNSRGDVTSTTTFSVGPNGSCNTSAVCTATVAGPHIVTGTTGSVSDTASLSVIPGPLDHLDLTPASSVILLGTAETYTATGRDQYNNSLGDMTPTTVFTIAPTGTCTTNTCTDNVAGLRTVTGRTGTVSGTASLNIVNSIHHLVLSPASATITAGGSQAYTATAYDANNVALGNVTTSTVFTVAPDGSCTSNVCTASRAGSHVVTGNVQGATGAASLMVNPGPMTQLIIQPGFATITPGGTKTYQAFGRDAFGNNLGAVTSSTVFSILPDGSCSANVCGATLTGSHTVTGTSGGVSGGATLQVNPFSPVILTPADGAVTPKLVTVSGTAQVGSTVRLSDNGAQIADNIPVDGDGKWSIDKEFAGGTHNLTARAVIGGAISDPSATRMFTVDTQPPAVTITRPSGYLLAQIVLPGEQVEVSGTAGDQGLGIDRVEITYSPVLPLLGAEESSTLTCTGPCKSFSWSDTPSLGLGMYEVSAIAYDKGGNPSAPVTINLIVLALPEAP